MGAAVSVIGIVFLIVIYLAIFAVSITMYILNGIGLMKMAKSCGIPHPWMGFLAFTHEYLIGRIAEQNHAPGKKSWPWRHIALVGKILLVVLAIVMCVFMFGDMFAVIAESGDFTEYDVLTLYGSMMGMMVPLYLISTAYSIVLYIIYWKIFSLFAPQNTAVIFLVLSILFNLAPIFFFILRNRQPANRPGPSNDQWV